MGGLKGDGEGRVVVELDREHAATWLAGADESLPGMVEAVAHLEEAVRRELAKRGPNA